MTADHPVFAPTNAHTEAANRPGGRDLVMLHQVPMTLRPDDRALAAFLLERDLVALDDLVAAMHDAASSVRDLGESLVRRGTLDAPSVVGLRAEIAKQIHRAKKEDPTLPEIKRRPIDFDATPEDDDTWFDFPAQRLDSGPSAP